MQMHYSEQYCDDTYYLAANHRKSASPIGARIFKCVVERLIEETAVLRCPCHFYFIGRH